MRTTIVHTVFAPMIAGALVGGVASVMQLGNHYRSQLGPMTVREARDLEKLPVTTIAAARDGLVKIKGKVIGSATEMSYYDRVPCVALELEHYEVQDSLHGAKRVLLRAEKWAHPFFIEDETGRLQLDPKHTRIDYIRQGTDYESTIEEHTLRVGETVLLLAEVRRRDQRMLHPMRQSQMSIDSGLELIGSPLVTWRSEPEVLPRLAPPTGGLLLTAGSAALSVIGALLDL